MSLIPLQVTTSYSLLKSTITPEKLVNAAKAKHFQAIAIADRDVLYGAIDFYQAAKAAGIKPLIGLRLELAVDDLPSASVDVLLIARNQHGYEQLMKLSSAKMSGENQGPMSLDKFLSLAADIYVLVEPTADLAAGMPQATVTDALKTLAERLGPLLALGINLSLNQ